MILSQITKILEKAIKAKLEKSNSKLLQTLEKQSVFKAGISQYKNLTKVINKILSSR